MKNFLELMGINTQDKLTIVTDTPVTINSVEVMDQIQVDLLSDITITGINMPKKLTINGLEILPKFAWMAEKEHGWELNLPGPFYVWYFYATFQGFIA
jgi:hypothetical protein